MRDEAGVDDAEAAARLDRLFQRTSRRVLAEALVEWLRKQFPTPYPVELRWRKRIADDPYGVSYRVGRRLYVVLSDSACRHKRDVVNVLLHEWAHCMEWRHETMERRRHHDHDDAWGLAYARIYRAWFGA